MHSLLSLDEQTSLSAVETFGIWRLIFIITSTSKLFNFFEERLLMMNIEWLLFVILLAGTLINLGIQIYIHFEAYPLLSYVGKGEFGDYLKQYEKRLFVPLMLPYGITILSNIALVFIRPEIVPVLAVIIVLVLNLGVAIVSVVIATPVYNRISQAGEANGADMATLMRINLIRLALSALSGGTLVVILYLVVSGITR